MLPSDVMKTTRTLHIWVARDGCRAPADLLRQPDNYQTISVRADDAEIGTLFVKPVELRLPDWYEFLREGFPDGDLSDDLRSGLASGVLLVPGKSRMFALTFGHGRHMLNLDAFEPRFGLRTTLNAVPENGIRSVDRRVFNRVRLQASEQAGYDTGIDSFGVDVDRDLVRAAVGTPTDQSLAKRLGGRTSLSATLPCALADIPSIAERFWEISQGDSYTKKFPWIDNIIEVTDGGVKETLNASLTDLIQTGRVDDIILTAPDEVKWGDIRGFRFRPRDSAPLHPDLLWQDYFADVRPPSEFAVEHLSSDRVYLVPNDATSHDTENWMLRKCIAGEIQHEGTRYILSEGNWYQIGKEFAERVHSAVADLRSSRVDLPPYSHESEGEYNEFAAGASAGELALMDKRLIPTGVARNQVEFCDLYSRDQKMFHVKRHGASSVLSHMVAQGVVSARAWLSDPGFREAANGKLPMTHRIDNPAAPIDPREFEINYAVIGKPRKDFTLPFFTMVSLVEASKLLREMQYRMHVTHVPNEAGI